MNFFAELKRRNVIRAVVLYVGAVWALAQGIAQLSPVVGAPEWVARWFLIAAAIGFPFWIAFAWFYEFTSQGLKRESEIAADASITRSTGRRMDRAIIGVLAVAVVLLLTERLVPHKGAGTAVPDQSIAVLPFANMSADAENEFFSDGVSEEILNSLARIPALKVVGRTSSFQFKGKNEDLRAIGAKLGVAHVLEGSVRREGERARITAQLIRAADGTHVWSQTYDRTLQDTLAVQLDIAENVAGALDVVLDDRQRERMHAAGVENVDAFIHYQKGWRLYLDSHRDKNVGLLGGLHLANAEFDQAIALEPNYSMAHYAKADLYEHTLIDDDTTQTERENAQRAVLQTLERAAATGPDAQQREFALAERKMLSDDWRGITEQLANALSQPGCNAPNWMPVFASAFGYGDALEPVLERAAVCDPLNTINWNTRAWVARAAGKPERMQAIYAQLRSYTPAVARSPQQYLALAMLGREDELRRQPPPLDNLSAANYGIAMQIARLRVMDRAQAQAWTAGQRNRDANNVGQWQVVDLTEAALFGDRADANRRAALLDARPAGGFLIAIALSYCGCGAPFDLDATPNFKTRLAESGLPWPPPLAINYPPLPAPPPSAATP